MQPIYNEHGVAGLIDDEINTVIIEHWHEGALVQRWKSRGGAADGSGTLFLHQQFRTAHNGRRIVHAQELTCMTDAEIDDLMGLRWVTVVCDKRKRGHCGHS